VFHTLHPLLGFLSIPFQLTLPGTDGLFLSFNVLNATQFIAAGVAVFALIRELDGAFFSALMGGLAFSFTSYHYTQLTQMEVAAIEWLPICAFLSVRTLKRASVRYGILTGIAFGLTSLTDS